MTWSEIVLLVDMEEDEATMFAARVRGIGREVAFGRTPSEAIESLAAKILPAALPPRRISEEEAVAESSRLPVDPAPPDVRGDAR